MAALVRSTVARLLDLKAQVDVQAGDALSVFRATLPV